MAVPGRISAGRAGPAESAWPPETKVRTECLLGSPKHPSRSATGRVLSPQSRRPAEHRSTPAGCVRTPKASSARRRPSRRRLEIRVASSRFMGSGCRADRNWVEPRLYERRVSKARVLRTRHGAIPEGLGAVRSLDRPRPQVRSFLDGFFRKVAGRRRDGIHKSVSELSVNVDDKLAGKERE